jgi:hypothetical protein
MVLMAMLAAVAIAMARPSLGWNFKTVTVHEILPATFWDGTFTVLHEKIFRKYLCASPSIGPQPDTGYGFSVLYRVFIDHRNVINPSIWVPNSVMDNLKWFCYMYIVYMFIHLYPCYKQMGRMLWTPLLGTCGESTFLRHCKPLLLRLGAPMQLAYTKWKDLYHKLNRKGDYKSTFTGQIDTFPVRVWQPRNYRVSRMLFNPKYQGCVFKVQLLVTNMMRIAHAFSLCLGTLNDNVIFDRSRISLLRKAWEWWNCDSAYYGCERVLVPHKRPRGGELTKEQRLDNTEYSRRRQPVEHVNAYLKTHNLLSGTYRGTYDILDASVRIAVHTTALALRTGGYKTAGSIIRIHLDGCRDGKCNDMLCHTCN